MGRDAENSRRETTSSDNLLHKEQSGSRINTPITFATEAGYDTKQLLPFVYYYYNSYFNI